MSVLNIRFSLSLSYLYKLLNTNQPSYQYDLISPQPLRSTFARPPSRSSVKITDRSFRHASPRL